MNLEKLIAAVRAAIASKLTERQTHATVLDGIRSGILADNRAMTDEETARAAAARADVERIDAEIQGLRGQLAEYEQERDRDAAATQLATEFQRGAERPAYDEVARVQSEPRVYSPATARSGVSFFSDAFNAEFRSSFQARDRLSRHQREVEVEREASARAQADMQERATTTASFAGLVVPQYLVDQAALIARAGRPFANTAMSLELPDEGTQFLIPKGTTGAATAVQATENTAVQSTDEVWTNVTVPVGTIAGQQDVSRQSLERGTPGIDSLIYMDLAGAYAANLDSQCLTGSGASGQLTGVTTTSGINAATAFGAAVSVSNFFLKVAGQVQAVAGNRFLPADAVLMHPRRWGWYLGQVDSTGRPVAVPSMGNPQNAPAVYTSGQPYGQVVGYIQGLPVVTDANVPTNAGTINEDLVFVYRSADALLWEDGDGMPRQLRFEQTLGNQLTVKLVVYGYAAFTIGRYPAAFGKIGGLDTTTNGLIAPTF